MQYWLCEDTDGQEPSFVIRQEGKSWSYYYEGEWKVGRLLPSSPETEWESFRKDLMTLNKNRYILREIPKDQAILYAIMDSP